MMIDRNKPYLLARAPTMAFLLVALMGVARCSSVPDAVNPVEWYRGVGSWFESDENKAQRDQVKAAKETAPPLPGTNRPYPNLSTVPERPRSVTSPEERNRVSSGLAADRDNARYAKPEEERPSGAALGAPVAAPRTPVILAPSGPSPDTLEPLPRDTAPLPPPTPSSPSSSIEDATPAPVAAAPVPVELPTIEPASFELTVAEEEEEEARPAAIADASTVVTPPPAQPAPSQVVAANTGAPAPQGSSVVEQAYNAALMQQSDYATAMAAAGSRTVGGTPIPRSFLIHFSGGSAQIGTPDRVLLREVVQLYKSTGGNLRIVGHASSRTSDRDVLRQRIANLRVSTQRAEAVASELARLGVPRANMTVAGVSDNDPAYQESAPSGEAGNRRVEIFFDS